MSGLGKKIVYSFIVWILVIFTVSFIVECPEIVKILGKDYVVLSRNLQTEIINIISKGGQVCSKQSKLKVKDGCVWDQISLSLSLYYGKNARETVKSISKKTDIDAKLLEEGKKYVLYGFYYKNLLFGKIKFLKQFARVAIIFDDTGTSIKRMEEIVNLKVPVTVAILPFLNYSKKCALMAEKNDIEVMLHLPMEPHESKVSPGIDTVTVGMSDKEVSEKIKKSIEYVPFVKGVNNHMGSKATEDCNLMDSVMKVLKAKNLYFIDSKTSSKSTAYSVAKKNGVSSGVNGCYLDNSSDFKYISGRMELLMKLAKKKGKIIAIGHARKNTINAVKKYISEFEKNFVEFVCVSDIIKD